jgi:hypothetical protein
MPLRPAGLRRAEPPALEARVESEGEVEVSDGSPDGELPVGRASTTSVLESLT